MSEDEKYTNIEIDMADMPESKQLLLFTLINEGRLRERDRIIELIEQLPNPIIPSQLIAFIKGEKWEK
jgi:hypothetical protein